MRTILILVGLFLVVLLIKRQINSFRQRSSSSPKGGTTQASATGPIDMVECAYCQVHLAATDAIGAKGRYFCSADHLQRHQQSDPNQP